MLHQPATLLRPPVWGRHSRFHKCHTALVLLTTVTEDTVKHLNYEYGHVMAVIQCLMPQPPIKKKKKKLNTLFYSLYYPSFGKFGQPYLGKATAEARAALPSLTSACWVFSCFCNPPNSDMDDRIFNVRMSSFICIAHAGITSVSLCQAKLIDISHDITTGKH